jgi:ketosteroid isomerase-like protein
MNMVSYETVDAFYAAYSTHDVAGLAPLLHDDVEWTISGPAAVLSWCGTRRGKAAVLDLVGRDFPSVLRVVNFTRSSILIDGDQAATLNRLSACRCGDHRVISYRLAHFMRFKDDKVISNMSLIDSFDAAEQMLGHALVAAPALAGDTGDLVLI